MVHSGAWSFDCVTAPHCEAVTPLRMTGWGSLISMIKAVRGTRDLLPPETALWNFVEAAVPDVFPAYNFQEIRTPIFEATARCPRGVGGETDRVSNEMYTRPGPPSVFEEIRAEHNA